MRKPQPRIVTFLLAVVWLAVVIVSVFLAVTRREEYGVTAYIVPGMAFFMLVIFVIAFIPKKAAQIPLTDLLGKLSVGALILFAIAVLLVSIFAGNAGIVGTGVLVLFTVVFTNIFIQYVKDFNKPKRKSRKKRRKMPQAASAQDDEGNGEKP